MNASSASVQPWITSSAVIAIWNTQTRNQIIQAQDLNYLPFIVLSASERPNYGKEEMDAQQDDLAMLSTNSLHQTVAGASHESLVAEQKNAHIVAEAIGILLEVSQTGEALSTVGTSELLTIRERGHPARHWQPGWLRSINKSDPHPDNKHLFLFRLQYPIISSCQSCFCKPNFSSQPFDHHSFIATTS